MIDHIGLRVQDIQGSAGFYDSTLKPLGFKRGYSGPDLIGYSKDGQTLLWLHRSEGAPSNMHIAFAASDRGAVEAFHAAGLAAGGRDNGAPGTRPDYGPTYFAAFLLDPDGNNVEAVRDKEVA